MTDLSWVVARGYTPAQIAAHEAHKARMARLGARPAPVAYVTHECAPEAVGGKSKWEFRWKARRPTEDARRRLEESIEAALASPESVKTPAVRKLLGERVKIIKRICAEAYDVSVEDLEGPRRRLHYVTPRFTAMWLMEELCKTLSLLAIGERFNRDHTTVINALNKTEARIASDPVYASIVAGLKAKAEAMF